MAKARKKAKKHTEIWYAVKFLDCEDDPFFASESFYGSESKARDVAKLLKYASLRPEVVKVKIVEM